MPAYSSTIVTASSQGAASGGAYTATLGAFSSGTASMLPADIAPRTSTTCASLTVSISTPSSAASRRVPDSSSSRKLPPR